MAKVKNLKKRIRRLEARLQKGAKKLAKLKQKLETATTMAAAKAKPKPPARAKIRDRAAKPRTATKESRIPAKKKRTLNLTPERRAQLAAAMKARWAAKKAAAAPAQNSSATPNLSQQHGSHPQ